MGEWLAEVWRSREILYFLAWRDVKVRYKQAVLGVAWAVLQPLFTMITFAFFFGKLAGIPSDGVPYPLFSYSALLLWTYFSVTLSQVGNSLVANSSLITKIYFPRGMLLYYRVTPRWTMLLAPIFVGQTVLLVTGVGMLLAALNVRYRDVKYTIPFLTQIGLFVTPIIYPVTFLPHRFQGWLALTPMTGVIQGFRACLFGGHVDWNVLGCSWIMTLSLLLIGSLHFRSTERVFADIV